MEEDDIPTFAARIKAKYPDYASLDDNELVERVVRKHPVYASQVKLPPDFKLLQTSTGYPKLDELYEQAGRDHNVDPNLLLEQGRVESVNFNPDVVYGRRNSPAGARGLGQFMPGTAPLYGLQVNGNVDDRTDPTKSVPAQAKYMRKLLDQFDNDEQLALAGYNAGEYRQALKNGQIPKIKETQDYVKIIGDALKPIRAKRTLQSQVVPVTQEAVVPDTAPTVTPTQDVPPQNLADPSAVTAEQEIPQGYEPPPTYQGQPLDAKSAIFSQLPATAKQSVPKGQAKAVATPKGKPTMRPHTDAPAVQAPTLTEQDYQDYFKSQGLLDTEANRRGFEAAYNANKDYGKDVQVSAEVTPPDVKETYVPPVDPVQSQQPTPTTVARGGKGDIDAGIYTNVPVDQGELIGQADPNAYLSKKATYALADANGISRSVADQWLAKKGGNILPEALKITPYEQSLAQKGKTITVNFNNSLAKDFMTFAGKDFVANVEKNGSAFDGKGGASQTTSYTATTLPDGRIEYTPHVSQTERHLPTGAEFIDQIFGQRDENNDLTAERKAQIARRQVEDKDISEAVVGGIQNALGFGNRMQNEAAAGVASGLASSMSWLTAGASDINDKVNPISALGAAVLRQVAGKDVGDVLGKFGNTVQKVDELSTPDEKVYKIARGGGNAFGSLPAYAVVGVATGGNPVLTFGLTDFLISKGKGESSSSNIGAGLKGVGMGTMVGGFNRFGTMLADGLLGGEALDSVVPKIANLSPAKETAIRQIKAAQAMVERATDSASLNEAKSAQNLVTRLLAKHNLTLDDVMSGKISDSVADEVAVKLQDSLGRAVARKIVEKGTPVGIAFGVGAADTKIQGGSTEDAIKNGLMFAAMQAAGTWLHKTEGKFTDAELNKVDGAVVKVTDTKGKSHDLMLLRDGDKLKVTEVDVPPEAVQSVVLPKDTFIPKLTDAEKAELDKPVKVDITPDGRKVEVRKEQPADIEEQIKASTAEVANPIQAVEDVKSERKSAIDEAFPNHDSKQNDHFTGVLYEYRQRGLSDAQIQEIQNALKKNEFPSKDTLQKLGEAESSRIHQAINKSAGPEMADGLETAQKISEIRKPFDEKIKSIQAENPDVFRRDDLTRAIAKIQEKRQQNQNDKQEGRWKLPDGTVGQRPKSDIKRVDEELAAEQKRLEDKLAEVADTPIEPAKKKVSVPTTEKVADAPIPVKKGAEAEKAIEETTAETTRKVAPERKKTFADTFANPVDESPTQAVDKSVENKVEMPPAESKVKTPVAQKLDAVKALQQEKRDALAEIEPEAVSLEAQGKTGAAKKLRDDITAEYNEKILEAKRGAKFNVSPTAKSETQAPLSTSGETLQPNNTYHGKPVITYEVDDNTVNLKYTKTGKMELGISKDALDEPFNKIPDKNSPTALKQNELAQLPSVSDKVLKDVKSTVKDGFLELSPEGVELNRSIDAIAKEIPRTKAQVRYGTTYRADEALTHLEVAKDLQTYLSEEGRDTSTIDKYIADFEQVAKEHDGLVPLGITDSQTHETLHVADIKSQRIKREIIDGVQTFDTVSHDETIAKLKAIPAYSKFKDALEVHEGRKKSDKATMMEAIAYLGDGEHEYFGLTIKQSAKILRTIIEGRYNALLKAYNNDVSKVAENMSHFNIEGGEKIYEIIQKNTEAKSTDDGESVQPSPESDTKREAESETTGSKDNANANGTGTFAPGGKVKPSKTPETLRGNLDLPVKNVDYTSTTNNERHELATQMLNQGVNKAHDWVETQIKNGQNNHGATVTVGIGVMNELGASGDVARMNELAKKLLPTITDAAQTVQAVSTASMWNPESAAAYAAMSKQKRLGKGLTTKEATEAIDIAKAMHDNIVKATINNTQLAELETQMAKLIDENIEYKDALEVAEGKARIAELDLKKANETIKALEKVKGETKVRVKADVRKHLNQIQKDLPEIEARLAKKYAQPDEQLYMAAPSVDRDLIDWTLWNLSKNLTGKSPTEIKNEIRERTNGLLSEAAVNEIHAQAVKELQGDKVELTQAQKDAKAELTKAQRNRLSHYTEARQHRIRTMDIDIKSLIAGEKPLDFKHKFVDYILDAGQAYTPEAIYVALARTKLKNGQQLTDPNDVITALGIDYPDLTHEQVNRALTDSEKILREARENLKVDNIQSKYNEKLTAQQIDYIRQDQANVMNSRRKISREAQNFYEGLIKSPTQLKVETLVNFRRANLLTGLKTHGTNIVGNATYQAFDEVTRPVAKVADYLTSLGTGERTIQGLSPTALKDSFKALVTDKGILKASGKVSGLQAMKDIWANGGTNEDMQRLQHAESVLHRAYDAETQRKRYKASKAVDYYINKVYRSLGAEDAFFKVFAFTRAMHESAYAKAKTEQKAKGETNEWRKNRQKQLIENPSQVMIQEADDYAQFMTFQNDNAISTLFQQIKSSNWGIRAAGETIVPFDRTPTNLIMRTLELMPVTGLVSAGYKLGRIKYGKGKKFNLTKGYVNDADFQSRYSDAIREDYKTELGKMSQADAAKFMAEQIGKQYTRKAQADFARTVARMAPGNALFALGGLLAAGGFLTGAMWGGDDDKAEKNESMARSEAGIENRSLYIPNVGRFVLPKAPPFDAMVAGATFYEQSMSGKKDIVLNGMNGATETLSDIVWEQPLLNSTKDLTGKLGKGKFGEFGGNIASGFIPASGLQREVSDVFDPVRRSGSGYIGNKKEDDTWQGTLMQQGRGFKNSLLKGVPGARNYLVDKSQLGQPDRPWQLRAIRMTPFIGITKPEAPVPYDKYVNKDWLDMRQKLFDEPLKKQGGMTMKK